MSKLSSGGNDDDYYHADKHCVVSCCVRSIANMESFLHKHLIDVCSHVSCRFLLVVDTTNPRRHSQPAIRHYFIILLLFLLLPIALITYYS